MANHITICTSYATAFGLGDLWQGVLGYEYYGVANINALSNSKWGRPIFAPFFEYSAIPAFGISDDAAYLVNYARAMPLMMRYFAVVMQQLIDAGSVGLKKGNYPHILRANPLR